MAYTETACYVQSVGWTAVPAWAASHAYSVGNIVRQLAAPTAGNERCFICINGGTSVTTEPAWVLTRGAATNETTVHWMECTGLPAVNGDLANTNAWHASAGAIAVGWIISNVARANYFICTTAGTGGTGAEPVWNTTAGATTADGSVTWTCIGAVSGFTTRWGAPHARLQKIMDGTANWLLNSGMNVLIGDNSAETVPSGTNNYFLPNNGAYQILSVDHTATFPPALKAGANVSGGSGTNYFMNPTTQGENYVYGMSLSFSGWIIGNTTSRLVFDTCTITPQGNVTVGSGSDGSVIEFKNCTIVHGSAWAGKILVPAGNQVKFENCTHTGSGSGQVVFTSTANANVIAEGCDYSGLTGGNFLVGVQGGTYPVGSFTFKDCVIPSDMTVVEATPTNALTYPNVKVDVNRSDSGATAYRNERYHYSGTEKTNTMVARTGGAVDGATAISHQAVTSAGALFTVPFQAIPLAIWNAVIGSNRNVTLYGVAVDSRVPNNDEFWFDVEYLGSATSPKGSFARGSKSSLLASGSALTADTSDWTAGAPLRANSTFYGVGQAIKVASNPGRIFICTAGGTSASSEPTGGSGAVLTTLNSADKTTNVSLSGGNLAAVCSAAASNDAVRSIGSIAPGSKAYFELTFSSAPSAGSGNTSGGVMTGAGALSAYASGATAGVLVTYAGNIFVNGSSVGGVGASIVAGSVLCYAVDLVNYTVWARVNNGNWNNSGTANPATNTGGISISSLFNSSTPAFPVESFGNTGITITANFGGSSYAYTPPSGFGNVTMTASAINYSSAVDGSSGADGTATFRAGCRFSKTLTLSSPQPQQQGHLYVYPKIGRPSMTCYLDPVPVLS